MLYLYYKNYTHYVFLIVLIKELWKFVFSDYKSACVVLSVLPLGKVYCLVLYRKFGNLWFSRLGGGTLGSKKY